MIHVEHGSSLSHRRWLLCGGSEKRNAKKVIGLEIGQSEPHPPNVSAKGAVSLAVWGVGCRYTTSIRGYTLFPCSSYKAESFVTVVLVNSVDV